MLLAFFKIFVSLYTVSWGLSWHLILLISYYIVFSDTDGLFSYWIFGKFDLVLSTFKFVTGHGDFEPLLDLHDDKDSERSLPSHLKFFAESFPKFLT